MMNINNPWIRSKVRKFLALFIFLIRLSNHVVQAERIDWVVVYRICGEIAVSRSIGDPVYKHFTPGEPVQEYFSWPEGHSHIFMADLVIPLPECKVMTITKNMDFLIVASDGLWDVVSSQEAIDNVK